MMTMDHAEFTPATGVTRSDVVAAARGWLDTPFHHQGRVRGVGMDCIGLPIGVARDDLGLVSPAFNVTGYAMQPDGASLMEQARRYMVELPIDTVLLPGMVIVTVVDRDPQHFGILADYRHGGLSIVHASNRARPPRVIETRLMFSRAMRLHAAFDLPGVEAG